MPSAIAHAEINRQLEAVVVELEAAFEQCRRHFFLTKRAGGIAGLVGRPDLSVRLEAVFSGLTAEDFLRGAITNLDQSKIDATHLARFPSPQEMARQHPLCDDDFLIASMKTQADWHFQLCLRGDIRGAVEGATGKLALQDIGCTLAALGRFAPATAFIDAQAVEETAKAAVRFVVLLEKCRRGHPDLTQAVHETPLEWDKRLNVILALAGRLPWAGYPYSDW